VRGQPNLVAVTEGNDLALWDLRSPEKNGCTKRITVRRPHLIFFFFFVFFHIALTRDTAHAPPHTHECTFKVAGGPLHGLAIGEGKNAGAIAVGGAGRSVTLVDTRKWTPRNRATNLTKYEVCACACRASCRVLCVCVHVSCAQCKCDVGRSRLFTCRAWQKTCAMPAAWTQRWCAAMWAPRVPFLLETYLLLYYYYYSNITHSITYI